MTEFEKKVRDKLTENGYYFVRHDKGDYDILFFPINDISVTVDSKIKSRHTTNAIMKQSGIKFDFNFN